MKYLSLLMLMSTGLTTFAGEEKLTLKKAPDYEKVMAHCLMCHSVDYIQMNSSFLDKKGWDGVVNKMIKVMGAKIERADAEAIVVYLSENYGR